MAPNKTAYRNDHNVDEPVLAGSFDPWLRQIAKALDQCGCWMLGHDFVSLGWLQASVCPSTYPRVTPLRGDFENTLTF